MKSPTDSERQFVIFPDCDDEAKENKFEEVKPSTVSSQEEQKTEHLKNGDDVNKQFLDTQVMCSSPSANYYKPTDEPEPWDLTQLNIEASVMCLVSKVRFTVTSLMTIWLLYNVFVEIILGQIFVRSM